MKQSIQSILKNDYLFILAAIVLLLVLRFDLLLAGDFGIESDEAIVGLMAKHMLELKNWPIFYYGQDYMGSFEALCVAGLGMIIGLDNLTLKLVPLFFSVVLSVLLYLIAFELKDRKAARYTMSLTVLAPIAYTLWSLKARGGFIELLCFAALASLILIRAVKHQEFTYRALFGLSFILGIAWWINYQIIYFMLPVFIVVTAYHFYHYPLLQVAKRFCLAIFAFLCGSALFWYYNFKNSWASFGMFTAAKDEKGAQYFNDFFEISLPILLGARKFWEKADLFPYDSTLAYSAYALLLLVFVLFYWRGLISLLILKFNKESIAFYLILVLITIILVFSYSSFGHLSEAPRYLLPAYIAIFPIAGIALSALHGWLRYAAYLLFALLLFINLTSVYYPKRNLLGEPFVYAQQRVQKDHQELESWLLNNNYTFVKTNYWIGYRLAFETQEQVRFLLWGNPFYVRIPEYEKAGEVYRKTAPYIMVEKQASLLKKAFDLQGYKYKEKLLSGYHVVYDYKSEHEIGEKLDLSHCSLKASHTKLDVKSIVDQDYATRWGTGHPQNDQMWVRIKCPEEFLLSSLYYDLGKWVTDFPRSFQVKVYSEDGTGEIIFDSHHDSNIREIIWSDGHYQFYFPQKRVKQIELLQTGSDSFFDWSIAELEFYK